MELGGGASDTKTGIMEFSYSGAQVSSQWVFYAIRLDLDLSNDPQTSNSVRIRIIKGLSSLDNIPLTSGAGLSDPANLQRVDLYACTNLKLDLSGNYSNYFQAPPTELRLKTTECNFAGIKSVRMSYNRFSLIEELGDVPTPTPGKRGNLYKSLMMGGSTSLMKRLHFTNMDSEIFRAIFGSSSFNDAQFRELAERFKDGYGVKIPFTTTGQNISFFSNVGEEIFLVKDQINNADDYIFREMSSSILAEVTYILNPEPVAEQFTASVCFKTSMDSCLVAIQTTVSTNKVVNVNWRRPPMDANFTPIGGNPIQLPVQGSEIRLTFKLTLLPMDITIDDDGNISAWHQYRPKFIFEAVVVIHHKNTVGVWQAQKVFLRNVPVFSNQIGIDLTSNMNLRTSKLRKYGIYFESQPLDIQLYLEEIRYYHGSGISLGDS